MQFQFYKPSGILSEYIKHYWILESSAAEPDVAERVVPIGNLELMFHFKKPFVSKNELDIAVKQPFSIISGITNSYSDVSTNGESGVIAVTFYPFGACHFFDFPLSEVENQSLHLGAIYSKEIKPIEEQVFLCKTLPERIAVIEQFLFNRLKPVIGYDFKLIKTGVEIIKQTRGQISSTTLSEKLSVTTKNLERKFSALVGKTPKQFIKIVRFQEVMSGLSRLDNVYLTEYAYNNGYFDQSHFIKDFKALSGLTPKEFITRYPCTTEDARADFSI